MASRQRALFPAASVPAGVAAAAVLPAANGATGVFAAAMAVTRIIQALANGFASRESVTQQRLARAYLISAALFALSIVVPPPFRYVLWAIGIGLESGTMLADYREAMRRARRERDLSALKPADPAEALDAHHFAERFGLFLIIRLGAVVVEAGGAAVHGDTSAGDWSALVAAMVPPAW